MGPLSRFVNCSSIWLEHPTNECLFPTNGLFCLKPFKNGTNDWTMWNSHPTNEHSHPTNGFKCPTNEHVSSLMYFISLSIVYLWYWKLDLFIYWYLSTHCCSILNSFPAVESMYFTTRHEIWFSSWFRIFRSKKALYGKSNALRVPRENQKHTHPTQYHFYFSTSYTYNN